MPEEQLDRIEHRVNQVEYRVERIENKVDALTSRVDGLEAGQASLQAGQARLEAGQVGLEARQTDLETGQLKLAVKFDELRFAVVTLADGFAATNERVDRGFARVETMMQSFIDTQGGINRDVSDRDANHERRIGALERRKGMS